MGEATRLPFRGRGPIRSLAWAGDRLVDPAAGGASIGLDGSLKHSFVNWAYTFDRALATPGATVLYTALATKGLVIQSGRRVTREINRSFYHAHQYEYPVTAGRLFDGTEVLIHCPGGYNRLTIETLREGKPLASATSRASDLFQSRLRLSPDGRHLLTAGWVWHPYDVVTVYDLAEALADGAALDRGYLLPGHAVDAEVESACWLTPDQIVVSANPEEEALDGDSPKALQPGQIGVWSLRRQEWIARHDYDGHTGTLEAIGRHVLALFGHPRLVDPFTAAVTGEWPDLATGHQTSSIMPNLAPVPPVAVDAANHRFAVAGDREVSVVRLDPAE
jgi:hypothetical protein